MPFQKGNQINKGRKLSKEWRDNIGKGNKGKLIGRKVSQKTREKMSESGKKKVFTKEHKRNLSKAMKGKAKSQEHKDKQSKAMKGKYVGEKASQWRGGISFEPYSIDWTETLKRAVRERDNYICQICSQYGNIVHHIDYDKKNSGIDNLITLCRSCHTKTNYNRKGWIKYFGQEESYNNQE